MSIRTDSTHFYDRRWELWKQAKYFPKLPACSDLSLTFVLGQNNFGFSWGTHKRKYSGTKLDLSDSTVELKIVKMSYAPSLPDESRGEEWISTTTLCTIVGTVTSPDTDGEVVFSLSDADTDAVGDYLGQIRVTNNTSGKITAPGYVRFHFLESLF